MNERGNLTFDNPIQRRPGQWNLYKMSLLVHSILEDIVFPPMFFLKEDKGSVDVRGRKISDFDVLDGKQRLLNIFAFINGEFKLHENTPSTELEGEEYELAGKSFEDLDEELQENIENFTFNIYNLEGNSDEEIEEFFMRINGGEVLSTNQNTKARVGIQMMKYFNPFLEGNFFATVCNFSGAQFKTEVDFCTMLQCVMMLDVEAKRYNLVTLSEKDTQEYGSTIHDGLDASVKTSFEKTMEYLEKAFPEQKKEKWLRKTHVPMVFLVAKDAEEQGISPEKFNEWFKEFAYNYYTPSCDYAVDYCGAGSVKKPKVIGRIETMRDHFKNFIEGEKEEVEE